MSSTNNAEKPSITDEFDVLSVSRDKEPVVYGGIQALDDLAWQLGIGIPNGPGSVRKGHVNVVGFETAMLAVYYTMNFGLEPEDIVRAAGERIAIDKAEQAASAVASTGQKIVKGAVRTAKEAKRKGRLVKEALQG